MAIGMIIDVLCIVFGGILGAVFGKKLPENLKDALPAVFSISTFAMAITSIIKLQNIPVVILALILGTILGTAFHLEKLLRHCGEWVASLLVKGMDPDPAVRARNLEFFAIAVILFCAGPTGIYGGMRATVAGDNSLLFSKCILDIFTAGVFAASAGYMIALLAAPMFALYLTLTLVSGFIMPLMTPAMLADFSGCGGLLILATGFRMAEIRMYRVTDMLPALILVMPISHVWTLLPL